MTIRGILLMLAGAAVLAAGADGKQAAPAKPAAKQAARQADAQADQRIEAEIRSRLAKSKIGAEGFTVRVQGGVAYWEGTTSVPQRKGAATRMAKSAGARQVINNIKVTDAAAQKAAENLQQGRRRAQVKRGEAR
jgi:hypothetical protein